MTASIFVSKFVVRHGAAACSAPNARTHIWSRSVGMLATQICGWDARNSVARASSSGMPMSTQMLRIASSTSVMPSASFVRNWDSSVCFCSSGNHISSTYSSASCMN